MTTSDNDSPIIDNKLVGNEFPDLRRISRIFDTVDGPDSPDVGGRRQRHASGLGFELEPLGETFTDRERAAFLQPLIDKKIRTMKIYQHLTSYQSHNGSLVRNFPAVDSRSSDTGSTALHWACQHGHKELVQALLYARASCHCLNNKDLAPIHLAVAEGHADVVEILLEHDQDLVRCVSPFTGLYPLHVAAMQLQLACADLLLRYGARVTQLTDEAPVMAGRRITVFHLAANKVAQRRWRHFNEKRRIGPEDDLLANLGQADGPDVKKTTDMLALLLDALPPEPLRVVTDSRLGSVLHYFAAIDFVAGIEKITSEPYLHPPDELNSDDYSPLLIGLHNRCLGAVRVLLDQEVDVERLDPVKQLTPLQLLIKDVLKINEEHLSIVDKLLEKGADPTRAENSTDSPVDIATSSALDVRLLEKFLVHVPDAHINMRDQVTGNSLLHHAAANCNADTILKILQKGADVTLENNTTTYDMEMEGCSPDRTYELPLEVAVQQKRSAVYFEAIEKYGISSIISSFYHEGSLCKIVTFIQTHLTACAKEMQAQVFKELTQVLFTAYPARVGRVGLTAAELAKILHFQTQRDSAVFCKTALNWANENNDRFMALELLKLERSIHATEEEGLECLRSNLSRDTLLPWIIESYSKFHEQKAAGRWCEAFLLAFTELILFSYLPFVIDLYSDINLTYTYAQFAYNSDAFNISELFICDNSYLNSSSCRTGSDHPINYYHSSSGVTYAMLDDGAPYNFDNIRHQFDVACWMTAASVIFSSIFYIICIYFDDSPSWLSKVEDMTIQWGRKNSRWAHDGLLRCVGWLLKCMLWLVFKILWPVVHIARRLRYLAALKRSEHKARQAHSEDTWNNIKTVEYGIEASLQLFLQLWLLRPFLPGITVWDSTQVVTRCVSGIANFLTFNIYPACYLEKALGKILLTIISVSLGVAQMRCNKPGLGLCEKPFKTLPILLSVLSQTVARIFAIRSLILLTSPLGYNKYLIFFAAHFSCVFLIKILFETKSSGDKMPVLWGCRHDGFSWNGLRSNFLNLLKFLASGISSTIVMVHLRDDRRRQQSRKTRHHYSFLSHTFFFLLVLVENLVLVCLPYAVPHLYPPLDCFTSASRNNALWIVACLWVGSVVMQVVHYKWAHPWAKLNGLQVRDKGLCAFTVKLCWKKDVQRVSVKSVKYSKIRLECEDLGECYSQAEDNLSHRNGNINFMEENSQVGGETQDSNLTAETNGVSKA